MSDCQDSFSSIFSASVKGTSIEYLWSEFVTEVECFGLVLRFNGSKNHIPHACILINCIMALVLCVMPLTFFVTSSADKFNSVKCGCTSRRLRMPQTEVLIVETKTATL